MNNNEKIKACLLYCEICKGTFISVMDEQICEWCKIARARHTEN